MTNRRARPTVRVLQEDLTSDWRNPSHRRALDSGQLDELHPLSELPHPIIEKALESFGPDPADDKFVGPIASSTRLHLLEIKQSQWRGGIWKDPESGVCWLVVAGLAKGNHQDRDDFYEVVKRENETGEPDRWLPSDTDILLLERETAARIRTQWELDIQHEVLESLKLIHTGGTHRFSMDHAVSGQGHYASVDLTVVPMRTEGPTQDDGAIDSDDIIVEFHPNSEYKGSDLFWLFTTRVLTSINPPWHGWDRFDNSYSNIGEIGAWTQRIHDLEQLVASGTLEVSDPGSHSHFTHKKHLAGKTINGEAVRALCGIYLVPTQDHERLPTCPTCEAAYAELPK